MKMTWTSAAIGCLITGFSLSALADDEGRRIEEVIVTAEKVEATVSDTSISITAIGSEMLEDMGISLRMNLSTTYLQPHATITTFVFEALGGIFAPWVATQALLHTTTAFTPKTR